MATFDHQATLVSNVAGTTGVMVTEDTALNFTTIPVGDIVLMELETPRPASGPVQFFNLFRLEPLAGGSQRTLRDENGSIVDWSALAAPAQGFRFVNEGSALFRLLEVHDVLPTNEPAPGSTGFGELQAFFRPNNTTVLTLVDPTLAQGTTIAEGDTVDIVIPDLTGTIPSGLVRVNRFIFPTAGTGGVSDSGVSLNGTALRWSDIQMGDVLRTMFDGTQYVVQSIQTAPEPEPTQFGGFGFLSSNAV